MLARILFNISFFATLVIGGTLWVTHDFVAAVQGAVVSFIFFIVVTFIIGIVIGSQESRV